MNENRSSFSSRLGFVLAAAGSAVGLGNLWRFPYLAAKYGGGIFLLVYIVLALTFGFALMVTEIALGRKTRLSCISAYGKLDKRFDRNYQALYSYKLTFQFTTEAGALEYLNGKSFQVNKVDFVDEYFPGYKF